MLKVELNLLDGLYIALLEDNEGFNRVYDVSFFDKKNNKILYETQLRLGQWAKLNCKYLLDFVITIRYQGQLIKQITLRDLLKGSRVCISFCSAGIGDTIAWIPYCLKLKELYDCEVVVSTHRNELFEAVYPELIFAKPGDTVQNIQVVLNLGVFWDHTQVYEPFHCNTVSLQQTASNLLCLPSEELEPRIHFIAGPRPFAEKYICIASRASADFKEWYYWDSLVVKLKELGYRVIETAKGALDWGAEQLEDISLMNVMNMLYHAELLIGLSSGISWINWALKKHTIMISNFTKEFYEFQSYCTRITNTSVCHGCWNDPSIQFDRYDVEWCPRHKNTSRQFECHLKIPMEDVLTAVIAQLEKSNQNQEKPAFA